MKQIKLACLIASVTVVFLASESQAFNLYIQQIVNVQMWQFGSSSPSANQSFDVPPRSVSINFSVAPKAEGSYIKVYDPYSNLLATGDPIFNGNSMAVNLPPLKSGYTGTYRVEWAAYCQCNDTRMLSDNFYFNIR